MQSVEVVKKYRITEEKHFESLIESEKSDLRLESRQNKQQQACIERIQTHRNVAEQDLYL